MRAIQLTLEPFELMSILEWTCTKEMGEHGVLRVKGLISEENRLRYYRHPSTDQWVCGKAIDENDEEIVLFNGVITHLIIHSEHELHTMEVEIKTGTFLLDQSLRTRAFQDVSETYESVLTTCLKPANGEMILHHQEDAAIGHFLLQYRQTDWAFSKRLANRLGLPIFPEFRTEGKRFHIGLINQRPAGELVASHFTFSRSSTTHSSTTIQGSYHVGIRDIYELGQPVIFNGKRLIIGKIESQLRGGELWHDYTLFTTLPTTEPHHLPLPLTGLSLSATVTKVRKDAVQVQIHGIENQEKEIANRIWFDYATVYSTPDGQGWYALPDEGVEVRLIFPEANEGRAYVASSVHLSTTGGRTNPDHKSFKNKQNMEILMTPDGILLRDNQGELVELSRLTGITVNSNHAIDIRSGKQIRINSDSAINLSAADQVSIQQKSSRIHMKDDIDISGGKINMN
ncbi:MAG: phage late control D family protein [Defluviitaleaceae bacterium]|nr:phage late control D family protein [Defluviitaleaceae bacterium]